MKFRPLTWLAAILLLAGTAGAQTTRPAAKVTLDLWPEGKMPGKGSAKPEGEVPQRADGFHRVTDISRPTIAVYPAPKKDGPAPAIIICPGGGYSYLVIDKEGSEIAEWLNSAGVTGIVLKYRCPNNRDGALQDVQRALSLTRAHAADWKIDPKRLGVIGFSAGGNLSAKASNRFDERAYAAIDAVDEQSCRPDFAMLVYPAYLSQGGNIAPDLNLKAKIPPTLIVHSEDDKNYVTGSKVYHAALDEAKVPNEFLNYPTGGHGYALHCTKDAKAWPDAALAWLGKIGVIAARPAATVPTPCATAEEKRPIRIAIIGDSTVCDYPADRPERGWGQFIEERFAEGTVKTTNFAASGRSTKTFIKEGRWQKTLDLKPDYILIQFGHNDSHAKERPESTDAATDYREFLRKYVDEARAAGATPILVTPMVRRTFGQDGKLTGILQPYADAMKAVAAEKKVAVIDLHASSRKLVEQLGPAASAEMANKPGDGTHFNEKGARAMADLVIKELPTAEPKLKALLKNP